MFARRLDECCALDVQEANSGDLLVAGRALICPGNRHMMVRRMPRGDMAVLSDGHSTSMVIARPSTFSFIPSPRNLRSLQSASS